MYVYNYRGDAGEDAGDLDFSGLLKKRSGVPHSALSSQIKGSALSETADPLVPVKNLYTKHNDYSGCKVS